MDIRRLRLPAEVRPLAPDALLLPMDMLRDAYSFAGVTLAASPYLDFARRVLAEPDLVHAATDYHRYADRLPERSDAGLAWGPDQRLTEALDYSVNPSVVVAPDGIVHVVWADRRWGNHEIYHCCFDRSEE
ncbi:hypothetical protein HGA89_08020, partial [bacterium]|nr:hypothetical protein [bacterium]